MSTSISQRSGTLLNASPPVIPFREIEGRSNSSELSRLNGRVSIRRKTSWAFRIALSPSHGVEPCAAVPCTARRIARTPLAWTPMCRSVGSPVIAKSPVRPSATSVSVERCSTSSLSSSGTHMKTTRTACWRATSTSAHIIAASPPFMS